MGTVSPRNARKNAGVTAVKNFEFGLRQPSRETLRNKNNKTNVNGIKSDLNYFIQDARRNRNGSMNIIGPKTQVRVPKELLMMKISKREDARDRRQEAEYFGGISARGFATASV
jgi:hypothetical protein